MRVALLLSLLASLTLSISAQCNAPSTCNATAQVPQPWFALTFNTTTSNTLFQYASNDTDGCGHRGLAITGNPPGDSTTGVSYIDLNLNSGPNSAGSALPGKMGPNTTTGTLATFNHGWTYEVTVKILNQTTWARVFAIGEPNGPYDVALQIDGTNNQLDFVINTPLVAASTGGYGGGSFQLVGNPNLQFGVWYHFVISVQDVDTTGTYANWFAYVNGVMVPTGVSNGVNNGNFNTFGGVPYGNRSVAYLGKSPYASDSLGHMEYDTFRIYSTALNAAQVQSLYQAEMGGCPLTVSANPVVADAFPNTMPTASTTPVPFFSLNFSTNPIPTATAGAGADYAWFASDEGDAACGLDQIHQGLIEGSGGFNFGTQYSNGTWVNLSTSTGPNSVGVVMPTFGNTQPVASLVSTGAQGLSFEWVFKPELVETWGKLADFGALRAGGIGSACNNDLIFGWDSGTVQYMSMGVCDAVGNQLSTQHFGPFIGGNWYHVVFVTQNLENGNFNWYMYLNGVVVSTFPNNNAALANVVRQNSYLFRSGWDDSVWSGLLDTMNLYQSALSPAQVQTLYNAAMGSSHVLSCPFAPSTISTIPSGALFYELTFNQNPAQTASPTYTWLNVDPTDSLTLQGVHQGIININNGTVLAGNVATAQYVNMSAASGPSSVGKVIGDVGGVGTGSISDATVGWSMEFVFKASQPSTWAKLMDLGDGAGTGNYEILFGWHNTDPFFTQTAIFAQNEDFSSSTLTAQDDMPISNYTIPLNTWLHAVIVFQYANNASTSATTVFQASQYSAYFNGVLVQTQSGSLYPPKAHRGNSVLGKSNYGDNFFAGLVDTFRVYSIALNPNQVTTLYQASRVPAVAASSSSTGAASSSSAAVSSSSAAVSSSSSPAVNPSSSSTGAAGSSSSISAASSSTGATSSTGAASSSSVAASSSSTASNAASSSSSAARSSSAASSSSASASSSTAPSSSSSGLASSSSSGIASSVGSSSSLLQASSSSGPGTIINTASASAANLLMVAAVLISSMISLLL